MTFDEYCQVREQPQTWRSRWICWKYRYDEWKRQKAPLFLVRYPLFSFTARREYIKAQELQIILEKLEQMAGIGITVSEGLDRPRNLDETLDECLKRAIHIHRAVHRRRSERYDRNQLKARTATA